MYINRCQNFVPLVVGVEQLTGPRGGAGVASLLQGIILLLAGHVAALSTLSITNCRTCSGQNAYSK